MPIQSKQQPPYYTAAGNIKLYKALLNQAGTNAPIATILQNTIGDIIWTRDETGEYIATLTAAFTLNKTLVFITTSSYDSWIWPSFDPTPNLIYLSTYLTDGTPNDGMLYQCSITIEVYP